MIKCPGCGNTLPDTFLRCQFCGADTTSVPRPVPVQKPRAKQAAGAPAWVTPTYYAICIYFILSGAMYVIFGLHNPLTAIRGAINIGMGLGLIFKIDFIRGIANILCWLQVLSGAFGVLGAFAIAAFWPLMGFLFVGLNVLQVATAGLMIYLIGETDEFVNI